MGTVRCPLFLRQSSRLPGTPPGNEFPV